MALTVTHLYINDGTESILIGAGNGDACDFPATLIAYEREVRSELAKEFPGVAVTYFWVDSNQGPVVSVTRDERVPHALQSAYDETYEQIVATVRTTLEDVYSRGTFWVPLDTES